MKTFVVRIFVPSEVEPHGLEGQFRGIVEEVGSERRSSFEAERELLEFLTHVPGEGADPVTARRRIEGGTP